MSPLDSDLTCIAGSEIGEECLINQVLSEPTIVRDDQSICHHCRPSTVFRLGDCELCGILDFGAEVSLVRESIFLRVEDELKLGPNYGVALHVKRLTGQFGVIRGTVDLKVCLPAEMISRTHTFAIAPDEMIPNCMLLGIDFMASHGLTINDVSNSCCQQLEREPVRRQVLCTSSRAIGVCSGHCSSPRYERRNIRVVTVSKHHDRHNTDDYTAIGLAFNEDEAGID